MRDPPGTSTGVARTLAEMSALEIELTGTALSVRSLMRLRRAPNNDESPITPYVRLLGLFALVAKMSDGA